MKCGCKKEKYNKTEAVEKDQRFKFYLRIQIFVSTRNAEV